MKETIYTIPVNEAFEQNCKCPLCFLEEKLEAEAVEYALGPAMMEPDCREISNKKGYCNKHFEMMYRQPNKLPLALVLDTHLEYVRKMIEQTELKPQKKRLFKSKDTIEKTSLQPIIDSCMICEKIEHTMSRYYDVLLLMWKNDDEFKTKFETSSGFCLPHFEKMYKICDSDAFAHALFKKELCVLEDLQHDIHKFTLKFDYRNKDMEWGNAKDAPIRTVEKLAGYINNKD
ncbi:MAG: DUF6062 family protein [Firmicutes bacterium]|nr:DUF6062 family protein [Bacillota bacterium]